MFTIARTKHFAALRVSSWLATAGLAALLLLYLTISLRHLAIVPRVYEDEPWQASTGWKLATQGVFGSNMFAGFYGMDQRYYGYMPIHPLLLAVIFRVAGVGLLQARVEPVLLGLLVLVLTYALARRLFDERVGLLAVLLLLGVRLTTLTPSQLSGILFLDIARIARYDMAVPVFGLAALHTYLSARARGGRLRYVVAGGLVGLSGLAHLYGLFWLPALTLIALWDGRGQPFRNTLARAGWLALGCALPWLPYAAYVLGDLESWRGQTRAYADRFDLLNARWYLENVQREPLRYAPGLPPGLERLLRVGFWGALVALPLALGALIYRGLRGDESARTLAVPALLFPLLFALLIRLKLMNYLVAFLPLWSLAVAWGGVALWDWLGRRTTDDGRPTTDDRRPSEDR
jgi:4-amino-4-deoxy-L-arabinose transferase-like glycosyltransferase